MAELLKPNVLNIHLTDKCNFCCKHCFVNKEGYELDFATVALAVDKFKEYLVNNGISNGRINLAGGEPLLYKELYRLIDYINSKNIEISIISNGTFINESFLNKVKGKVKTIGLSIDAISENVNRQIGRCTKKGEFLDLSTLSLIPNYGYNLKINVCVSKLNQYEDFEPLFSKVSIFRLKFLQMHCKNHVNELTKDEFMDFCNRYKHFSPIIETSEKMSQSYLILDSNGMLSCNNNHQSKVSIKEYSIEEALVKLNFNIRRFNERY